MSAILLRYQWVSLGHLIVEIHIIKLYSWANGILTCMICVAVKFLSS